MSGRTFHFEAESAREAACWLGVLSGALLRAQRRAAGAQRLMRGEKPGETTTVNNPVFLDDSSDLIL